MVVQVCCESALVTLPRRGSATLKKLSDLDYSSGGDPNEIMTILSAKLMTYYLFFCEKMWIDFLFPPIIPSDWNWKTNSLNISRFLTFDFIKANSIISLKRPVIKVSELRWKSITFFQVVLSFTIIQLHVLFFTYFIFYINYFLKPYLFTHGI